MPAGGLASARAITILGAVATTARACRLAGLDADASARHRDAYVRPACRGGADAAPSSIRWCARRSTKIWHRRSVRVFTCAPPACWPPKAAPPQDVAVHLLECGRHRDPWAVSMLRRAAGQSTSNTAHRTWPCGAWSGRWPDPPTPGGQERGTDRAGQHWRSVQAPDTRGGTPHRRAVSVTPARPAAPPCSRSRWDRPLRLCGRFAESVEVLAGAVAELGGDNPGLRARLQAVPAGHGTVGHGEHRPSRRTARRA